MLDPRALGLTAMSDPKAMGLLAMSIYLFFIFL